MPQTSSQGAPPSAAAARSRRIALLLLLSLAALASAAQFLPATGLASNPRDKFVESGPDEAARVRMLETYGRLPLRFEANRGQSARQAGFLARGSGYTLFLTKTGAVLRLRKAEAARDERTAVSPSQRLEAVRDGQEEAGAKPAEYVTLRLALEGANRSPAAEGLEPLDGDSNYFVGRDARAWRTNVPAYARVRYAEVYRGIDLVYYGAQGRLEYDFQLAPGADPRRIRLRFDGARSARVEEGGDLILSTEGGEVRQHKPVAYQLIGGQRREVAAGYSRTKDGRFGFALGEYDRSLPLVIDPVIVYSTYLGGSGADQGLGVAVDASGSAYVTGSTASANFPVAGGAQTTHGGFDDAFVLKLDSSGTSIVYATYLGGAREDFGTAIAVGADGSAYVAGRTFSTNFPVTAGALQTANAGGFDAFAAKLSPNGSSLVYATYLGGADFDAAAALAADASGNVYLAGRTSSQGLAGSHGGARVGDPIQRSTDGAANWSPSATGVTAFSVADIAVAPGNAQNVYAAASAGVYKSTDGGANWQLTGAAGAPNVPTLVRSVAVDPSNASVIYAAASLGVYKSTDGGAHYELKNAGLPSALVNTLAFDPSATSTVYAGVASGVYKTTNGGDTWTAQTTGLPGPMTFYKVLVNPSNSQVVYAATNRGVYKTTNGGASWAASNAGIFPGVVTFSLAFDPSNTNTLYVGMLTPGFGVYKSTDGGATWSSAGAGPSYSSGGSETIPTVTAIVVDPASPSTVYAATDTGGVFKSADGGAHWARSSAGLTNRGVIALALRPGSPAALLAGTNIGADGFAAKLDATGSALGYLRRLGGTETDEARGVAVDSGGNAYVAGFTTSPNFPVANALQPAFGGEVDAFLTKLDSSGAGLVFSTYLGGASYDYGYAVALGPGGSPYVTGTTFSTDFPVANAFQPTHGEFFVESDAFVSKFAPDGQALAYSTYLGGVDNDDDGLSIAVGSDGSAYVSGTTFSDGFPALGVIGSRGGGPNDAFVAKLGPSGSTLVFGGYLGGTGQEAGYGVAIDSAGGTYVVGRTTSFNFPVVNPLKPTSGGAGDAFVAKLGPGVELSVTLSDAPDPVRLGDDLNYTSVVRNNGDLAATGVALNLTLPAGAGLVSASTSRGTCAGAGPVVCDIGTLGGGEEATVVVVVKPPALKTASASVAVACNEPDSVPANNTAQTTTAVQFADLSVVKRAAHGLVVPGSRVNYFINVTNRDGVAAAPVVLADTLPAELSFVSCAATGGGVCGGSGNQVTVTWPSLAVGSSASVLVSATLGGGVPVGTVVGNTASVASAVPDPSASNDSSTAAVTASANPVAARSNGLIVFGSDRAFTGSTQPSGLYIVKPDGTDEKYLPGLPGFFSTPSWSPDGTKLAYKTGSDLKVANPDGSGAVTVATKVSFFNKRISWSPDGSQLAFIGEGVSSQLNTLRTINVANADGSGYGQLPGSPVGLEAADWSPDGTRFVYTGGSTISVMNLDGTGKAQLTTVQQTSDGQSFDNNPRWSPDGTKILFQRSTTNHRDLYVMNADGTGQAKLLNTVTSAQPEWSPDGTKLVFESLNALYVVNFDGSGQVDITHNGFYNFEPDWQPLPNANPTPTPTPVPTFQITGRLKALPGVGGQPFGVVKLSGTRTAQFNTLSANGEFTFVRLPAGGDYTLTVESDYYTFEPATREYKNLGADVSDADFTGTFVPADITGRVTDDQGHPLAGIKIYSQGGFPVATTVTDADGRYKFANVQRGSSYFIFPDAFTPYTFAPSQRRFDFLRGSVTGDFVGTRQATKVVSGRITEALTGRGIGGVNVSLGRDINAAGETFTDAEGNFSFGDQPVGHDYAVSVQYTPTYVFEPAVNAPNAFAQILVRNLSADQRLSFVAARRNTVQFSAAAQATSEGGVRADVLVTRTGDVASPAVVNYSTSDGTAVSTSDYTAAVGALRFAAGETAKTVSVLLTDDAHVEGPESFTLALDSPTGAQLGGVKTQTVSVADNDNAPAASNPIDSSALFVRQHYADFLNREPDAPGLAHWTNEIESCGADAACREVKRINVSAAFFLSIEFQETGYFVYRLHQAAYGTGETLRMKTFLRDTQEVGRGLVVGAEGWPEKLEANKRDFAEQFAARPEFVAAYPATLTPAQYVAALDANTGGSLTEAERAALAAALGSNAKTRGEVLRAVAENAEFSRRQRNRAFVLMQYFGYLRRNPNDAPDSDYSGHAFWLSKLEEFQGNYVSAEMVKAFLSSIEYRKRFGQ